MKPKVTVGVCMRNCEDFIKEAVDSIVNQDFPHELMELIFVDDGSDDKTLSTIQEYVSRIDVPARVFHTPWKGLGHARNIVAAHAKGEFVLWVDGDMILSKDFVTKLVEFMEQHPKVGIAKGKQALEHGGNLLATLETYSRAAGRMVNYGSEKAFSKALGTGGSIYRIGAMRQAGRFDENLRRYGEDMDMEIRVRATGWTLGTTSAKFLDYERHGLTWKNLWSRYWRRGYFTHYFLHKNRGLLKHPRMLPPMAFLTGFVHAQTLFKLTHEKKVFLLPFQYMFKMTAWYSGFTRSHLDSYEPKVEGVYPIRACPET
jgi:glycosyltransferase involved in cell wall biosynthesis